MARRDIDSNGIQEDEQAKQYQYENDFIRKRDIALNWEWQHGNSPEMGFTTEHFGKTENETEMSGKRECGTDTMVKVESGLDMIGKVESESVAIRKVESRTDSIGTVESGSEMMKKVESESDTTGKVESGSDGIGKAKSESVAIGKVESGSAAIGKTENGSVAIGKVESGPDTTGKVESRSVTRGKVESRSVTRGKVENGTRSIERMEGERDKLTSVKMNLNEPIKRKENRTTPLTFQGQSETKIQADTDDWLSKLERAAAEDTLPSPKPGKTNTPNKRTPANPWHRSKHIPPNYILHLPLNELSREHIELINTHTTTSTEYTFVIAKAWNRIKAPEKKIGQPVTLREKETSLNTVQIPIPTFKQPQEASHLRPADLPPFNPTNGYTSWSEDLTTQHLHGGRTLLAHLLSKANDRLADTNWSREEIDELMWKLSSIPSELKARTHKPKRKTVEGQ
ncbi:hypothetical protein BLNAU_22287 [Blattamonas nauphoetae]|uniref:Uncharacterized protein n=1 Tax=Blattamonas nauphoetae TaxID=2049346 RepID=A0ABQ9WU13_9EUKA|nr:hypothetical protein BLNAU_22287 [Blattamonas nauphoetae]